MIICIFINDTMVIEYVLNLIFFGDYNYLIKSMQCEQLHQIVLAVYSGGLSRDVYDMNNAYTQPKWAPQNGL